MRKKVTLRCCVLGVGVPLSIWFIINILYWNFKPSADWFAPSPNANKLHIRARKINGKRSQSSEDVESKASNSKSNSKGQSRDAYGGGIVEMKVKTLDSEVCDEVTDVINKDVTKVYDIKVLNRQGIVRTPQDQKTRDEGYQNYAFNDLISSRIGFHRKVPDVRNPLCQGKKYSRLQSDASIIICYYNEAISALLRNIYSVLENTPTHLLKEIIVVDDSSDIEGLSCKVKKYIDAHLPKVKFLRTSRREGLIRARVIGASHAVGKVLVFLDSHCEVNKDWLQPLLARISQNSKVVTAPIIDIIHHDSLEYHSSPLVRGGFNWGLHFRWDALPPDSKIDPAIGTKPIKSPTMAGGLFAIKRDYFHYLGEYDIGMETWGGENLEISFRIWMCGGQLEIIPCSRVGHIFRKRRPYGSINGGDSMLRNSLRVANVWMDDYKQYFYKYRPGSQNTLYGDVSDRIALRQKLQCKSFHWYLQNVYPEQPLPDVSGHAPQPKGNIPAFRKKAKILREGQLVHVASKLCVQSEKDVYSKKSLVILKPCEERGKPLKLQTWYESVDSELLLAKLLCLDAEGKSIGESFARLMKCHGAKGSQAWTWTSENGVSLLYNPGSGKCLAAMSNSVGAYITLDICGDKSSMSFELRRV